MIYIVVSIVMGILAINGGNNFHYLAASAILGYMLASGIAGYNNIRGGEVSLTFPDEIYALSPFLLTIHVRNIRRRPICLIDVKVGKASVFFDIIQPGKTASRTVMYTLPKRGECEVGNIELSSPYPFNFFTRYWPVPFKAKATVFPAQGKAKIDEARLWVTPEGNEKGNRQKLDSESDIVGVRPYVEGDSIRTIHWKSSARTGRLHSRLYDGDGDGAARIINLDALLSMGLETGLSAASYEISSSIKSGRPIGMKDRGKIWAVTTTRSDKLSMLSSLAFHE
jgi:uncharacterized protein (DUF58 family)